MLKRRHTNVPADCCCSPLMFMPMPMPMPMPSFNPSFSLKYPAPLEPIILWLSSSGPGERKEKKKAGENERMEQRGEGAKGRAVRG